MQRTSSATKCMRFDCKSERRGFVFFFVLVYIGFIQIRNVVAVIHTDILVILFNVLYVFCMA